LYIQSIPTYNTTLSQKIIKQYFNIAPKQKNKKKQKTKNKKQKQQQNQPTA